MLQYPGSPRKINDKIYFERHLRTCSQEPTQHERTCCTMLQYPGSPKKINDNIYVKRHPQCDFSAFLFGASGGQGLVRARNLSGGCYGKVLKTFHNQGLVLLPESSDNFVRLQCCFVWRCGYIPNTFTHACSTDGTAISNMYNWHCIYIYIYYTMQPCAHACTHQNLGLLLPMLALSICRIDNKLQLLQATA